MVAARAASPSFLGTSVMSHVPFTASQGLLGGGLAAGCSGPWREAGAVCPGRGRNAAEDVVLRALGTVHVQAPGAHEGAAERHGLEAPACPSHAEGGGFSVKALGARTIWRPAALVC